MTLTLTPKTEALLRAKAEREGQDVDQMGNVLLSSLLQEESHAELSTETRGDIRATAKLLAESAREAEPETIKVLLFPATDEVRLLYVDATARPTLEEETIAPFYFGPNRRNGIQYPFAVTLIRPEEEGHLRLPEGWGTWEDAVTI